MLSRFIVTWHDSPLEFASVFASSSHYWQPLMIVLQKFPPADFPPICWWIWPFRPVRGFPSRTGDVRAVASGSVLARFGEVEGGLEKGEARAALDRPHLVALKLQARDPGERCRLAPFARFHGPGHVRLEIEVLVVGRQFTVPLEPPGCAGLHVAPHPRLSRVAGLDPAERQRLVPLAWRRA